MQYLDLLEKAVAMLVGKAPIIVAIVSFVVSRIGPTYAQLVTDVKLLLSAGNDPLALIADIKKIIADLQALHDGTPDIANVQAQMQSVLQANATGNG